MADDLAIDAIRTWERLEGARGTTLAHWQDCANYMMPDRADFTVQRSPGMKRMDRVFDSTPIWALQQFASGLHGMMTSPTLRWFALAAQDDQVNSIDAVHAWLDAASEIMYGLFNGPRHNFASQSHELYLDTGCIGTAAMAVLESNRSGVLFSTRHMAECCIAENEEDRVDTLIRSWKYTAKQAIDAWGKACGEKIQQAYEKNPDQTFRFLHSVRPRRVRDPQRADAKHKPFESVYVCVDDRTVIGESGFNEFPYMVPRFSKSVGEVYGRGLGQMVLPDVKMLNEMAKTVLKSAQKIVDPPLQVPDEGFELPIRTRPGDRVFYRAGTRDRIEPLKTDGNIPIGIEMLNSLRQQVIRGMLVEWMLMPSNPSDPAAAGKGVTATYVLQQRDEKMRLLSPVLARMQSEFLGPLIDRVFAIMWRQSVAKRFGPGAWFPPPPPELSGMSLRVEYVSPIAIAQRTSQIDTLVRLIQMQGMVTQMDPNAPRLVDSEGIMRLVARDLNSPAAAMKSPEQVQQEQQAAAEAQQQMNAHAAIANVAGAAKDAGGAVEAFTRAGVMAKGAGAGGGQPAEAA